VAATRTKSKGRPRGGSGRPPRGRRTAREGQAAERLKAAERLESEGISARVIDLYSVKPVDGEILRAAAEAGKIPYSLQAAGRDTSTDADAIHIAREGIATAVVGVPNRYMHSPNEMVSLDDLDRTATLIADTCRAVDTSTDFTAR